ncbi:ricin-type beta-trefoil lectin domain protein [Streptomyces sp. BE303]|uniref:ricin-type beta-trefoil lectin domain protein n=1 Tax=Streptomyces sp. BE303 TaxID=3002528 RepID=UPI002E785389|nr:ricin-type beta-trefoil lectin domain protein [Streptomyces sp. BE303]MED7951998.1 ricin-type beta-trefoil lectin domain protein [Streptomyces sp. BE303]
MTVDELTTGSSLTVAQPDGRITLTSHLQAARVKKGGAWTPVDAGLARNADGSWSPKATPSGVVLSGGGKGPLATLTDTDGRSLALSLPFDLPEPVVTGAGARYANVLPGVDLDVTVSEQGAVREVLVVRDAEAAANPGLKALRMGTAGGNLTVEADTAGGLAAKAADGTSVFTAPTPVMWDSSTAPAAPAGSSGPSADATASARGAAPRAAAPAAGPDDTEAVAHSAATGAPVSSSAGPGNGATVRPVAVKAEPGGVTLTPDTGLLGGDGTTWPLYIDPSWTPTGPMGTNHFAQVMEGCAGAPKYDIPQANGQGVGYQQYAATCRGLERSYYEFNTGAMTNRMVVNEAKLIMYETYGANHDCNATAPVTAKWMREGIGGGTDWNHQPQNVEMSFETQWPKSAWFDCGGWKPVVFNVTDAMRTVAQQQIPRWTVGLFGNESKVAGNLGFMRFNTNPYVEANYDIAPDRPYDMSTTPDSQNPGGPACGGGQPGWIGMTSMAGNSSNIILNARATTPMPGTNLVVGFHVWDNMVADGNGNPADVGWPASQPIGSGGLAQAYIGSPVSDGHQYGWNARATDGLLNGPDSAYCYFGVDLTPPSLAEFERSTVLPPLGSGLTPTAHAGDQNLTIRVSSNDPTPGGCNRAACVKSGVRGFQYALDDNIPPAGANTMWVWPDADGTAVADIPVNLNRDDWGVHTLFVRAVDAAGNTQQQAARYDFYAPWNPANVVSPGDVTSDGTPDFLSQATDGTLTLVPGNSDFTAKPGLASTQDQSPEHDSWNNYLVAHRGSVSEGSQDDLIAFNRATRKLYVYYNDATAVPPGIAGHFSRRAISPIGTSSTCAQGIDSTWNHLTQMVATAPNGNVAKRPNLITVENGRLRYYPGSTLGGCLFATGTDLGTGDWSGVTLLPPGSVGSTPTLWARDDLTGAIHTYPLSLDAQGTPTTTIAAPVRRLLASGLSGLCGDVDHSLTENGTALLNWTCAAGAGNQQFTLGTDGSLHVLGKCVDVPFSATANDTRLVLWDCNNGANQKWVPEASTGALRNPHSGLCLGVEGGATGVGGVLAIRNCDGSAGQKWDAGIPAEQAGAQEVLPLGLSSSAFPKVDSPGDVDGDGHPDLYVVAADGTLTVLRGAAAANGLPQFSGRVNLGVPNRPVGYQLVSASNGSKCVDSMGTTADGHRPAVWNCWAGVNQKLTFAPDGTVRSGAACLSVPESGAGDGSPVAMSECVGARGQQWTLRPSGELYNPLAQRCLEIPGWDTTNGTGLGIWSCHGGANQRWILSVTTAV